MALQSATILASPALNVLMVLAYQKNALPLALSASLTNVSVTAIIGMI
jgi:hypothetical protein